MREVGGLPHAPTHACSNAAEIDCTALSPRVRRSHSAICIGIILGNFQRKKQTHFALPLDSVFLHQLILLLWLCNVVSHMLCIP